MLRLRLFYGLLTIILLLWGVGAAALILMKDSETRYDHRLRTDYQVIDASQSMRALTATINARYLSALAGPPAERTMDRAAYDKLKTELQERFERIHGS